jgi:enoyl-CoA hydratase
MAELVTTARRGRVLVISMQREAKRNAVDRALADALNTLEDDDDIWAGVLTGTTTVFSTHLAGTHTRQSPGVELFRP